MPKETPLQAGDIVHLNSGSPDLKVIGIVNGGREIAVEWQDSMGNPAGWRRALALRAARRFSMQPMWRCKIAASQGRKYAPQVPRRGTR